MRDILGRGRARHGVAEVLTRPASAWVVRSAVGRLDERWSYNHAFICMDRNNQRKWYAERVTFLLGGKDEKP